MLECIRDKGSDIVVSTAFIGRLKDIGLSLDGINSFDSKSGLDNVDFVFSVGGDGTLLETVSYVGKLELPIQA